MVISFYLMMISLSLNDDNEPSPDGAKPVLYVTKPVPDGVELVWHHYGSAAALALSSAACTNFTLPVSRAEVASSKSKILGFLNSKIWLIYSCSMYVPPISLCCLGPG